MRLTVLLLLAISELWLADDAAACSCIASGPPCKEYQQAPVIFAGRVLEIGQIEVEKGSGYVHKLVKFQILEAFKGVTGTDTEVITGQGDEDCGYGFRRNGEYLVYAYRDPRSNKLEAGICSRTRSLGNAEEDLKFLRGRDDSSRGSGIEGQIIRLKRDRDGNTTWDGPLRNVRVVVEGPGGSQETRTGRDGHFAVWGLPAGTYDLRADLPAPLLPAASAEKVEITPQTCGYVRMLAAPPYHPPE